jgi:uncharacterized FlgJ-related protein
MYILDQIKFFGLIYLVKNFLFFRTYRTIPTGLILAKAIHETGNFGRVGDSRVYRENKNLFGMKQSKATPGGFIEYGTKNGHAAYHSYLDSIRDYFVRQKHFNISGESVAAFVDDTVKSGYAEDTSYKTKWLAHFETVKSKTPWLFGVLIIVLTLITGLCIWLLKRLKK